MHRSGASVAPSNAIRSTTRLYARATHLCSSTKVSPYAPEHGDPDGDSDPGQLLRLCHRKNNTRDASVLPPITAPQKRTSSSFIDIVGKSNLCHSRGRREYQIKPDGTLANKQKYYHLHVHDRDDD